MMLCRHAQLLFVALVVAVLSLSATPTQAASASRPNIVLVVGEDMGPDLGVYGCQDAITPNMDRLAREGALFTRAFTHCGVCAPSRSGMITGQYPLCYGGQNMRSVVIDAPRPGSGAIRRRSPSRRSIPTTPWCGGRWPTTTSWSRWSMAKWGG